MESEESKVHASEGGLDGSGTDAGEKELGILGWLREIARTWGPAILAVILIRTFIFEPFRIPSGSMVPTLLIGDHVLVTKFSYGVWLHVPFTDISLELADIGDPERGDVVVFRYPRDPSLTYIKRVVAVPGDTIEVKNNQVILNGVPQEREFLDRYSFVDDTCHEQTMKRYVEDLDGLAHGMLTSPGLGGVLSNSPPVTVPADHVFVMGDNRDNSEDSRKWGFVSLEEIKGKAHFVWLSWNGCRTGDENVLRMDRFFKGLYE